MQALLFFLPVSLLFLQGCNHAYHRWGGPHLARPGGILFILLIVLVIILLFRRSEHRRQDNATLSTAEDPYEILRRRYAKGELSEETYRKMKQTLTEE